LSRPSNQELDKVLNAPIIKRSVMIAGHATSVSIEKPFWDEFKRLAKASNQSINELVTEIDEARSVNLSSAIRLYVLECLKQSL
jgi:predicted DNA-binding ribbon-helix-helix protein